MVAMPSAITTSSKARNSNAERCSPALVASRNSFAITAGIV